MKRILSLLLLLATLLSLVSCSSSLSTGITQTQGATQTATGETEEKEVVEKEHISYVADPLTWDDINAIPVANSSMSVAELRQICVDFMHLQLTFPWQPNSSLRYKIKEREVNINYGTVYGGHPYVVGTGANIYQIMEYYNENTGILDTKTMGAAFQNIMGNQCSGSAFWGWARVSNTITWNGTPTMTHKNGAIALGNYVCNKNVNTFLEDKDTTAICQENGEQVMYQSYALLQMADGIVQNSGAGHVRMIVENAHVQYNGGVIDGNESYVIYQDQQTNWTTTTQSNGKYLRYQGGVNVKISFKELYDTGYVPFTLKEFIGESPVEKATASLDYTEETISPKKIEKLVVESNYAISEVFVVAKDENGNVLERKVAKSEIGVYTYDLSQSFFRSSSYKEFANGKTKLEVSVRVSTGETLPLYTGTLVAD